MTLRSTGLCMGALVMLAGACAGTGMEGTSTQNDTGKGGTGNSSTASAVGGGGGTAGSGGAGTVSTGSTSTGGAGTGGAAVSFPEPPCGVFVLGSAKAGFNQQQTRDYPFVDGFVLRMFWSDFTPAAGVYDFADVDAALARVAALGQKLSIQIIGESPPYVVADAAETWVWHDQNPNHAPSDCTDGDGCVLPLPWDPKAIAHRRDAVQALAAHVVDTGSGAVPLAEHASLALVQIGLPGWSRIRELFFEVEQWPGYSRSKLVQAVTDALDADAAAFPHKPFAVGFWAFDDGTPAPAAWEDMNQALLGRYSAANGSRLGYFQENLQHGVSMGIDSYGPLTSYAKPLAAAKDQTFVALQMLTSWTHPFTGEDKVAGGSPHEAMAWAHETYGTRYFEVYADDTDTAATTNPAWADGIDAVRMTLGCGP